MIYQQIKSDIISAMKSKQQNELIALRNLDSTIKNFAINSGNRSEISDNDCLTAISQMVKRGTDSAEQFKNGNRNDLAEIELFQVELYRKYLPMQMSEDELRTEIRNQIPNFGTVSQKDFGKLMKHFSNEFKGRADNKIISTVLKQILEN